MGLSLHLAGDVEHAADDESPLVVPGHLTGVGPAAAQLRPEGLCPRNISLVTGGLHSQDYSRVSITCVTSHLGNPSSSPDQFIIDATPGLVEAPGRDGVSVLA